MSASLETSSISWTPIKSLASIVEAAVLKKRPGMKYDLEVALRKHKPHFVALLKNPVSYIFETFAILIAIIGNFRPGVRATPIWSARRSPRESV